MRSRVGEQLEYACSLHHRISYATVAQMQSDKQLLFMHCKLIHPDKIEVILLKKAYSTSLPIRVGHHMKRTGRISDVKSTIYINKSSTAPAVRVRNIVEWRTLNSQNIDVRC